MAESNMAEFNMAAIIKLSQNEWVKFFVQMLGTNLGKCEWVWQGKTKMVESKMVEFQLAEFKVAAIIKMSLNEWVKIFLCKMATKMAEFNMAAIIKLSQNEWLWVRLN